MTQEELIAKLEAISQSKIIEYSAGLYGINFPTPTAMLEAVRFMPLEYKLALCEQHVSLTKLSACFYQHEEKNWFSFSVIGNWFELEAVSHKIAVIRLKPVDYCQICFQKMWKTIDFSGTEQHTCAQCDSLLARKRMLDQQIIDYNKDLEREAESFQKTAPCKGCGSTINVAERTVVDGGIYNPAMKHWVCEECANLTGIWDGMEAEEKCS